MALHTRLIVRLTCLVLCLLALACSSTPDSKSQNQTDAHYDLGLSYMKEGKYQDAFVELNRALETDHNNKLVHNALGLIHLKFEDFDKAERSFREAIDADPEFSDAHNNLGVVYTREGKWDEAIKQFQNALKNPLYQSPEMAYYNLGNAYYRLKKYTLALKHYKDALKRAPSLYPAYYGLALANNALEDYGEASTVIMMGIKNDPEIQGSRQKALAVFDSRMVLSTAPGEKEDYKTLIEILHY
ncbi:MAG: tetratricopeptide repeat protein [bacterium]